jgi:simple sugar transport system permease protein
MVEQSPTVSRPTLVHRAALMVPPSLVDASIISTAALLLSLVLFGLFVLCSGVNPFETYQLMLRGAFGTAYSWRSTMIHAAPIMLTALCVVMPARVGLIIIGGEGCVVLGGLTATLTAHLLPNSSPLFVLIAMIVVGSTTGGLWIMAVGALRLFRGVNETISSLLLNYIALAVLNHCVEGPMHDPDFHDKVASWSIGAANTLGNIPGTEIHWGLIYGLVICAFCWVLMDHTTFGFATKIVGGNIRAARISGLSVAKYSLAACFIGGSAAALAGVVEIAAIQGRANSDLACGYGYAGILVAFVARQNPLAVIPVALLLGGVASSGDLLQAQLGLSSASVQVFQGILFLCILGLDTWAGRLGELGSMKFLRPFSGGIRAIINRSPKGVVHASN